MDRELYPSDGLVLRRINYCDAAATEPDEHVAGLHIETNVIRVLTKLYPGDLSEVGAAKDPHRTVTSIRDEYRVGRRDVGAPLRLALTPLLVRQHFTLEIDHPDRVVA